MASELLGRCQQQLADAGQRIVGAAAVAQGGLLGPSADLVDHGDGQLDGVQGGLQDHEPQTLLGQVPGHGQPGLAPPTTTISSTAPPAGSLCVSSWGAVMGPPPGRGPR
jgi:hypothetical protein